MKELFTKVQQENGKVQVAEQVFISGVDFQSPIITGAGRKGAPKHEEVRPSSQRIMIFEFEDKLGIIDFCDDQYFGWIRNDRSLIRGEHGEIQNNVCHYIKNMQEPIP